MLLEAIYIPYIFCASLQTSLISVIYYGGVGLFMHFALAMAEELVDLCRRMKLSNYEKNYQLFKSYYIYLCVYMYM